MSKIAIIGADGIGGHVLAQQCAHFVRLAGDDVTVFFPADDAKFRPIKSLFPETVQLPEEYQHNNNYERDIAWRLKFQEEHFGFDRVFYTCPDLLFNNVHAFDCAHYNTFAQIVKETRILAPPRREKKITLALSSTTPNYTYFDIPALVNEIATRLPDFEVYVPTITKWNNQGIPKPDFKDLPANVNLEFNPDFVESLEKMKSSSYAVVTDNGVSHIFFQWHTPRLVLDPQYQKVTHDARWKENCVESVPINVYANYLADIVELNIRKPYTSLVPRIVLLQGDQNINWEQVFALKKE